jgi:hypothetical protein
VLAIACAGAQYRFEHKQAVRLFFAAKAILFERIKERERNTDYAGISASPMNSGYQAIPSRESINSVVRAESRIETNMDLMQDARCLMCLIVFSAWKSNREVFRASVSMQAMLVQCVREYSLDEDVLMASDGDWHSWTVVESNKRTTILAFCFLNLMSLAYHTAPLLLASDIKVSLPCSNDEWEAPNDESWLLLRSSGITIQLSFSGGLAKLLSSVNGFTSDDPATSALGNYALLHGLLQRVIVLRLACFSTYDLPQKLSESEVEILEYVSLFLSHSLVCISLLTTLIEEP